MKKNYIKSIAMAAALACAAPALAQSQHTVSGTVVDENGEPVIGATVRAGKVATVTDLDGRYKLDVPANTKVTISYIGYKDATTTGGRVQMSAAKTDLDEVVVVGYGTQKKAHLTGSVATVPMDEISDLSSGGLATTLSGLMNGVSVSGGNGRPGENATITVRDANSLSAIGSTTQQPLFVIDGYIYPNDVKVGNSYQNLGAEAFNNLDPSEVESISVLKDASAAVYGARGANGVILVTTKRGKVGAPVISYNGTFGFTDEVARPKMLSAYDYGRLYNAITAADPTNTTLNHKTALFQADELEAMKNLNYDLLDKYWETGFTQKHSVNVSGASDRVNYFAGISYFDQDGNLGRLDYNRFNYRAGVNVKVSKWLGVSLNVSGDDGNHETPFVKVGGSSAEKEYNLLLTRPRYIPEYLADGIAPMVLGPDNTDSNSNQDYSFSVLQNNGDYSKTKTTNSTLNASVNYDFGWSKILKGLKLSFSYSKSVSNEKTNQVGSQYTIYKMNERFGSGSHLYTPFGDYTDVDYYYSDANLNPSTVSNGNYLSRTMTRADNYQMNFTAQYSRNFGQHHIQGLFSIERSEAESEYLTGQVTQPTEYSTGQSNGVKDGSQQATTFTRYESGDMSYIGRINYSYADKYLFEALLRADASTKFAPENRWGYFPAVSAGWVMSEEPWFKNNVHWVDFLKLRSGFGLTGRDNTYAWQWMQVYAQDKNHGTVFGNNGVDAGSRIDINKNISAVNRGVTWDKSYKFNFGVDARFLKQRLSVTFDAYRIWNRDMLLKLAQAVDFTIGTQSAAVNEGEMDNWGYELALTWRDKIGKDFKYHIGLNTGYSDNKVLNMDWATSYLYKSIQYGGRTDIGTWGLQCIGMFRSFQDIDEYFEKYHITKYLGMTKDQIRPGMLMYKDVRGSNGLGEPDGEVNVDDDQVQLSHRSNPYGFTINAGAEWKQLSFSFQFRAAWGGYTVLPGAALKNDGLAYTNMPSFWNPDNMFVYQDIYDGSGNLVMSENRDAYYPNLAYASVNSVASSFWRVSAASVQLSRFTLAYALPKAWVRAIGLQSVRFNLTGQNLINFYNPYPDHFMNPMAGSYGSYPNLRKWTLGVNVTF